jgi:Tol biopolymer transport system component
MKTRFTKMLLMLVFAIVLASCETSATQFKPLNLDSQYNYFNPIWSPTGDAIVFTREITDTSTDVWVVNRNGDLRTVVAEAGKINTAVSLSPDGQTIAYTSGIIENTTTQSTDISVMTSAIWLVNIDGSNQRNITENIPDSQYAPLWSPNGQYISFISTATTTFASDIWVYDVNNNATRNLTSEIGGAYGGVSWSPDSQHIAVFLATMVNEILILDVVTGNGRTLVEFVGGFDWSRVSNEIVYYGLSLASPESPIQGDIYIVDANGGTPRNITNTQEVDESFQNGHRTIGLFRI